MKKAKVIVYACILLFSFVISMGSFSIMETFSLISKQSVIVCSLVALAVTLALLPFIKVSIRMNSNKQP